MSVNIKLLTRHLNVPECRWNELDIYEQLYIIQQINQIASESKKDVSNPWISLEEDEKPVPCEADTNNDEGKIREILEENAPNRKAVKNFQKLKEDSNE